VDVTGCGAKAVTLVHVAKIANRVIADFIILRALDIAWLCEQTMKLQEFDSHIIPDVIEKCIEALKPWKKGPLKLFGTDIDTEWRSDMKWERLQN